MSSKTDAPNLIQEDILLGLDPNFELGFIYGRIEVAEIGHRLAQERWQRWATVLGWPVAVISAITAASALAMRQELTAPLAFFLAILTATISFFKPGDKAELHRQAAKSYGSIRTQVEPLMYMWVAAMENPQVAAYYIEKLPRRQRIIELVQHFMDLESSSPDVPRWATTSAQTQVGSTELASKSQELSAAWMQAMAEQAIRPTVNPFPDHSELAVKSRELSAALMQAKAERATRPTVNPLPGR